MRGGSHVSFEQRPIELIRNESVQRFVRTEVRQPIVKNEPRLRVMKRLDHEASTDSRHKFLEKTRLVLKHLLLILHHLQENVLKLKKRSK